MTAESQPPDGPPSIASASRSFTVRDAMIFVTAAAVGALGYTVNDKTMTEVGFVRGDLAIPFGREILGGPGLASLTAGLTIVRLFPPRPPRIGLFRQPGFVAMCVALMLTARCFLEGLFLDRLFGYDDWFLAVQWEDSMREASVGIPIALLTLALAGCLRAERSWIDRTSRAVALLWVAGGIASRVSPYWLD